MELDGTLMVRPIEPQDVLDLEGATRNAAPRTLLPGPHDGIVTVDTRRWVEATLDRITLASVNTGLTLHPLTSA